MPLHKGGIIAVRHKADVLAVPLAGVAKAVFQCQRAHLRFCQRAQREQRVRQLPLRHAVEHVALVLARVQPCLQQHPPIGAPDNACVMSRGHMGTAHELSPAQQRGKLDVFVAVDTGVGRFTRQISLHKAPDHIPFKSFCEIKGVVPDAQPSCHGARVLHILQRAAGARAVRRGIRTRIQAQRHTRTGPARLCQQQRRNRAVHTPAHSHSGTPRARCLFHCVLPSAGCARKAKAAA